MIYYSRYLMDLCIPWLEESSPLFERSTSEFCSLINEWNKKSATFIECQRFHVLSNIMTKGYWSSNNNNNNTQNYTSYSICCTFLPGANPKSFHNAMRLAQQDYFGTYFLQLDGPFRPFDII
jgi:hypothetical protein